ncbi:MAG: hypothetical protein A2902_05725 [Elusimicrobia bacterium RIFCSPLOWO2_01_FULL_64_13]|nr:MAG: hypothetical protein A2636_00480 [Elusimicrobia bacterium RIFCSPHIGHO2_01_FULL_64_10]OGR94251.1 MAG: hypothetical protein A2902_05725 [Elusimicrobia bacterium RIFCSPLOWO2_01_FULL_64_13]
MNRQILLTPGPTPIPPESLQAESLPIIHHRTAEFVELFNETQENLKYVFQTREKVFTLMSSGTGGMECAVVNLVSPGDKVIVTACGVFGERWVKILNVFGANVVALRTEWGVTVKAAELEKALKDHPDAKAVFTTLTDTSTATACDILGYGKAVSKTPAILVVDAISGLAGQEMYMDEWQVDAVITASQKGLMTAPGLGFISVSPKGWAAVQASKSPRFYWDLRAIEKSSHDGETPFTPAVSLIRAVNASLKLIRKKGLPQVFQQARDLAKFTREEGGKLGLGLFAKDPCDVLTAFVLPEGVNGGALIKQIVKKTGISMAGGQEKLKGRIVRIAHMGYIQKADIEKGIRALSENLAEMRAAAARP